MQALDFSIQRLGEPFLQLTLYDVKVNSRHFTIMSALLTEARQDYTAGRYQQAADKYRQTIETDANNITAMEGLAFSLVALQQDDKALELCKTALKVDPTRSAFYHLLGIIYKRKRQYTEGEQAFRRALELDPKRAESLVGLGNLLAQQKRFTEAESLFKRALELDAPLWQASSGLAFCYALQKHRPEAFESARNAFRLSPSLVTRMVWFQVVFVLYGSTISGLAVFCLVLAFLFQSIFTLPFFLLFEIIFVLRGLIAFSNKEQNSMLLDTFIILGVAIFYLLRQTSFSLLFH